MNMKATQFDFVRDILHQAVADGVFPSAVCAIGIKSETLCLASAGDATLSTRYDVASLTKIMSTAMITLRMMEEGRFTLDTPISRFLDTPADKSIITIKNLLSHTSGFEPSFLLEKEALNPDDAVSCILRRPLVAKPGKTPRYSCIGYILLGKILERIAQAPLSSIAQEIVFQPLGMRHTGYLPTDGSFAPTEVDPATGVAWRGIVHDENARFLGGVSGNAGLFADIADCVRYATMLATGGHGFLSSATFQTATQNQTTGPIPFGLGFRLAGSTGFFGDLPVNSFGHTGFTGTSIVVEPATGLYIVLLTNRVHPSRDNMKILRFRQTFHSAIFAKAQTKY